MVLSFFLSAYPNEDGFMIVRMKDSYPQEEEQRKMRLAAALMEFGLYMVDRKPGTTVC